MSTVTGSMGGKHIGGQPLTTKLIDDVTPGLLQNSIDERIVKVRPMSTPIDQLSRCVAARKAGAMTVEYYSVDTKKTETELTNAVTGLTARRQSDGNFRFTIAVNDSSIFEVSETVLIPSVTGNVTAGASVAGPLACYVTAKDADGIEICPLNLDVEGQTLTVPDMAAGTRIVRMGRAASELDVQTAQFSALPVKAYNNCQIFKMQVEQGTLAKIARKEVGWNFTDQEEAAIIDMRLGMEKNFLFGSRARLYDASKSEYIYFTGGIWQQAASEHELNLTGMTEQALIDLCAKAFTGNNGSKRKILIAGTELVSAISKIQFQRSLHAGDSLTKWGVKFGQIESNFGTLYVLHSEVFDQCGHSRDGFVLDPDYMTKYVHVPFRAETLDLRSSGVRNTDAVVLTEASCLVLRYPQSHLRVIGK